MKKYLVTWACGEAGHPEEEQPDGSGGGVFFHDSQPPIPCADQLEVGIALQTIRAHGEAMRAEIDWAIFEQVDGGGYQQRAITFHPGGRSVAKIG